MADELGTAVLRIEIDDGDARDRLKALRADIEQAGRAGSRGTRTRGGGGAGPNEDFGGDLQSVRRFNLRALKAVLESITEDIESIRSARNINIGSSWTKALEFLLETKEDIDIISAGRTLNLRSSWNTALDILSETKEDIDTIAATRDLNLRSSWNTALNLLAETKEDIDSIAATKNLNLRSSWNSALSILSETKEDIDSIAATKNINLRSSWNTFLSELAETKTDIDTASAATRVNLRSSWAGFLQDLQDTKAEIDAARREADIAEGRRVGRLNVSPVRGGRAFPGSPGFFESIFPAFPTQAVNRQARAQQLRQQRGQNIVSNALIGGAFPLLFGQGAGAAIGGAGGGAAGGAVGGQFGFGLSLIGTAVGAQFDALLQKATALGRALENPIENFGALQEGALLSSRGLEKQVEGLIAVGRAAEAAALIQQDLAASYGDTTAAFVKSAAEQEDRANREFNRTFVGLGAFGKLIGAELQAASRRILEPAFGIFPDAPPTESTAAPPEVTASEERRKQLLSQQFRLIDAQVQGYKDLVLERQREIAETERQIALDNIRFKGPEADPEREKINTEAAKKQYEITQQITQLDKQRAADVEKRKRQEQAALLISTTSSALQSQAIERQIAAVRELGSVEVGAARDALNLRQQVTEQIATAQATVTRLGSEISAARLGGDEPRARALVLEQQNAAKEVQLAIERGALALRDSGKQLLEDAKSTARSLQGLREDNLQFQTPQEQERTIAELRRQVQAEATRRGVNVSFQGTPEEQRRQMRGFVSFGEEERRLVKQGEDIASAITLGNKPLLDSNSTLSINLTDLAGAVTSLVQKDWTVYVDGARYPLASEQQGLNNRALS